MAVTGEDDEIRDEQQQHYGQSYCPYYTFRELIRITNFWFFLHPCRSSSHATPKEWNGTRRIRIEFSTGKRSFSSHIGVACDIVAGTGIFLLLLLLTRWFKLQTSLRMKMRQNVPGRLPGSKWGHKNISYFLIRFRSSHERKEGGCSRGCFPNILRA